jgi:Fic family protein
MRTLQKFLAGLDSIPMPVAWYLEEIAESRGRQELFLRQSPQVLETLREHAMIESAVSSNRIEGVEVDQSRVATLVFGKAPLKDRNEEEVRGYRDALSLIHTRAENLPVSESTVRELHRVSRGDAVDGGVYKSRDIDIIQTYPDGSSRIRFQTVPAVETPLAVATLFQLFGRCREDRNVPFLLLSAALNLDILCIHPFRDGNGRVSRLLLLQCLYHAGIQAGRFVSLERVIEDTKEQYYDALERSSKGWHEGAHDPWPYLRYVLFALKTMCRELEKRVGEMGAPRGAKTELVETALKSMTGPFALQDIQRACPGVSREMIRKILKTMKQNGSVKSTGRGPGARWENEGTR